MHVLVLGATGSIGTAVTKHLINEKYTVTALARSQESQNKIENLGCNALLGDIRSPKKWSKIIQKVDAVIHVAATFTSDMGEIDTILLQEICNQVKLRQKNLRFIYTGGCWLYGATGNNIATEETAFNPIAPFSWMVINAAFLMEQPKVDAAIIHPAMVYHEYGGVFEQFIDQATNDQPIEVWGDTKTRWPLIHRNDLAKAYEVLLKHKNLNGHFNVSSETGVNVGKIAEFFSIKRDKVLPVHTRPLASVIQEHGDWAEGPTLDQQMSAEKLKAVTGWKPEHTDFSKTNFSGRG